MKKTKTETKSAVQTGEKRKRGRPAKAKPAQDETVIVKNDVSTKLTGKAAAKAKRDEKRARRTEAGKEATTKAAEAEAARRAETARAETPELEYEIDADASSADGADDGLPVIELQPVIEIDPEDDDEVLDGELINDEDGEAEDSAFGLTVKEPLAVAETELMKNESVLSDVRSMTNKSGWARPLTAEQRARLDYYESQIEQGMKRVFNYR